MPSLPLSDSMLTETPKDKKEKKSKKMKINGETLETAGSPISEKKSKTTKKTKESKKRKALEMDNESEEERSGTSSEIVEPVSSKKSVAEESEKKSKKNKKAKVEDEGEEEEVKSVEEDPNAVSRFRISAPLKAKLKEKGIEALFPIQAMTFDTILDGSDLVGRARTGQVYLSLQICLHIYMCVCLWIFQLYWFRLNLILDHIYVLNLINWEAIFEASKLNII